MKNSNPYALKLVHTVPDLPKRKSGSSVIKTIALAILITYLSNVLMVLTELITQKVTPQKTPLRVALRAIE